MGIDNNQLVARYFDRKADHAEFFKALETYLDDKLGQLYATLETTFADTVVLSVDDAIAQAIRPGQRLMIRLLKKLLPRITCLRSWLRAACGSSRRIRRSRIQLLPS